MYEEQIERIKAKVETRNMRLNPPASLAEIEAFEHSRNLSLPESFREFLLKVGNGGDGFTYGWFTLNASDELWLEWEEETGLSPNYFIKTSSLPLQSVHEPQEHWQNTLLITNAGCDFDYHLIVDGPWRGQIWGANSEALRDGLESVWRVRLPTDEDDRKWTWPNEPAPGVNFLDWFEFWLDNPGKF